MWNKLIACRCSETWNDVAVLLLRVALGVVFFMHGYMKVFTNGIEGVQGFLTQLGVPMADSFAYVLAYGELIAGALLVVGLFSHWASKFAMIILIGAFYLVHMKAGFYVGSGGYEFVMVLFAAAFSVMVTGSGKYSL